MESKFPKNVKSSKKDLGADNKHAESAHKAANQN